MLLTITTTHTPATDLGYLLHKSPFRAHAFELTFGKAHVFYPEAEADRCTAALLVDSKLGVPFRWLKQLLLHVFSIKGINLYEPAQQVWFVQRNDTTPQRLVL